MLRRCSLWEILKGWADEYSRNCWSPWAMGEAEYAAAAVKTLTCAATFRKRRKAGRVRFLSQEGRFHPR